MRIIRIYIYCIIITASIGLLGSCVSPKSVRPTGSYLSSFRQPIKQETTKEKVEQFKNKNNNPYLQNAKSEFDGIEQQIASSNAVAGPEAENDIEVDEEMIENFPSLLTQLRLMNVSQVEIRDEIREIKSSVQDIDTRLAKLESGEYQKTQKRALIPKRNEAVPKNNTPKNTILPDEKITKEASPKKTAQKGNKNWEDAKRRLNERKARQMQNTANERTNNNSTNEVAAKPNEETINDIKQSISEGKYKNAINQLTEMIENLKDPVTINVCNFYLGESHLGMQQYDKAAEFFQSVINYGSSEVNDDALFKMANAKYEMGNVSEAKKYYQQYVSDFPKSEYQPIARKMLQQI